MRGILAGALAIVSLTTPAAAKVATFDFEGQVVTGTDDDGVFGPFGANLAGLPYQLKIMVDFAKGGPVAGSPLPFSLGGDDASSPLTVRLKIGATAYSLYDFGSTTSYFESSDPLEMTDFAAPGSSYAFGYSSFDSGGLYNALFYSRKPGDSGASNNFSATLGDAEQTILLLGLAVPMVGGVPEPSTWALFIFGVAACGVAMRRSKAVLMTRVLQGRPNRP